MVIFCHNAAQPTDSIYQLWEMAMLYSRILAGSNAARIPLLSWNFGPGILGLVTTRAGGKSNGPECAPKHPHLKPATAKSVLWPFWKAARPHRHVRPYSRNSRTQRSARCRPRQWPITAMGTGGTPAWRAIARQHMAAGPVVVSDWRRPTAQHMGRFAVILLVLCLGDCLNHVGPFVSLTTRRHFSRPLFPWAHGSLYGLGNRVTNLPTFGPMSMTVSPSRHQELEFRSSCRLHTRHPFSRSVRDR